MLLKILHKESLAPTRKDPTGSYHGRGRAPTTLRCWMGESFNTHGTRSTYENTISRDNMKSNDASQFPSLFSFTTVTSFIDNFLLQYFIHLFKLRGAGTFLQTHGFFLRRIFRNIYVFST